MLKSPTKIFKSLFFSSYHKYFQNSTETLFKTPQILPEILIIPLKTHIILLGIHRTLSILNNRLYILRVVQALPSICYESPDIHKNTL